MPLTLGRVDSVTDAGQGETSPWNLLTIPGEIRAASYLAGSHARQYRLIVDVLAAQQEVSLTGVGHDELTTLIRARLPADSAAELLSELNLTDRLASLVAWGTCEAWQDKATTEEEFLRNRYRYQLTEAGAALNQAVRAVERDLGPGSTAVLLAPAVLADRLRAALDALAGERLEDASREFSVVETTLDVMAREASQWQSRMAAALGGIPDQVRITRLLETILAYVDAWGAGVDAWSGRITACLPELEAITPETWRALTLQRLGAEINTGTLEHATTHLTGVVAVLERWFSGELSQATLLRRQMRDAVTPVLRGHRALLSAGGTVSRSAELARLADACRPRTTPPPGRSSRQAPGCTPRDTWRSRLPRCPEAPAPGRRHRCRSPKGCAPREAVPYPAGHPASWTARRPGLSRALLPPTTRLRSGRPNAVWCPAREHTSASGLPWARRRPGSSSACSPPPGKQKVPAPARMGGGA